MINQIVSLFKEKRIFNLLTLAMFLLMPKSAFGMFGGGMNRGGGGRVELDDNSLEHLMACNKEMQAILALCGGKENFQAYVQQKRDIEHQKTIQKQAAITAADKENQRQHEAQLEAMRLMHALETEKARAEAEKQRKINIDLNAKYNKEEAERDEDRYKRKLQMDADAKKKDEARQLDFEKRKNEQKLEFEKKLEEMRAETLATALDKLGNPAIQSGMTDRTKIFSDTTIKKQEIESKQAVDQSKIKWDGLNGMMGQIRDGLGNTITSPKRMSILGATAGGLIACRFGFPVLFEFIKLKLVQPEIIAETSIKGWFSGTEAKPSIPLKDIIVDKETSDQLTDIATRLKSAPELFNFILHGPPGTGKTAFAKAVALESGRDYIIVSCNDFEKFENHMELGLEYFEKLIKFARQCKNGVIVFFDEADSIFMERTCSKATELSRAITNKFLALVPKPTDPNIGFIFAANNPFLFDPAIRNRASDIVKIDLPALPERIKLLDMYINKSATENNVKLASNINNKTIAELASQLDGVAPRQIEDMAKKMATQAGLSKIDDDSQTILTKKIAQTVIDLAQKRCLMEAKLDEDRKEWLKHNN